MKMEIQNVEVLLLTYIDKGDFDKIGFSIVYDITNKELIDNKQFGLYQGKHNRSVYRKEKGEKKQDRSYEVFLEPEDFDKIMQTFIKSRENFTNEQIIQADYGVHKKFTAVLIDGKYYVNMNFKARELVEDDESKSFLESLDKK